MNAELVGPVTGFQTSLLATGKTTTGIAVPPRDHRTARACPVDHETGWRSQIRIEATSRVPRQT